ncbi:MAG: DUF378 domain-containing protein [Candidatus Omnitrophica bacterium]|nr:DUF378 domain-containing protein [Candidatus Omnitrophota bacterium]
MTSGGKCAICKLVGLLVVVGAINWGLVGVFNVDLVAQLLGPMSGASRAVYGLIGIAGVLAVLAFFKCCPCQKGSCETKK